MSQLLNVPGPSQDAFTTLNNQIATLPTASTYANWAALKTYIQSVADGMAVQETRTINIITGDNFDDARLQHPARYAGTITKITSDQFTVILMSRFGDCVNIGVYGTTWNMISTYNQLRMISVGSVSFSGGVGTKAITGIKTTDKILAGRQRHTTSSILVCASCTVDGTLSLSAFDTSANSGYSGTLSDIVIMVDSRS